VGTARGITKLYGVAAEDGGLAHQRAPRVRSMGARAITPASWSPLTSTLPRGPAAVVDVDHVSPAASGIAPRVQIPRVLGPRRNHCTCRDAARDGDGHQSLFLVFLLYCPRAFVPLSPRCLQRKRRGEGEERRKGLFRVGSVEISRATTWCTAGGRRSFARLGDVRACAAYVPLWETGNPSCHQWPRTVSRKPGPHHLRPPPPPLQSPPRPPPSWPSRPRRWSGGDAGWR
jgi:hypothetical protein